MKVLVVGLVALGLAFSAVFDVHAVSTSGVIAQVQAGGSGQAAWELVTLYNNTAEPLDVTGWCVKNKSTSPLGCFTASASNETVHLAPYSHALIASNGFEAAYPEQAGPPSRSYDIVYVSSGGKVTGSSDTLSLYDASGLLVDQVSWTSLDGGQLLQRRMISPPLLIDTDDATDFIRTTLAIPTSGISYLKTVVDLCGGLDGVQEILPDGYGYDEAGNCELLSADECTNIENVQLQLPEGMLRDSTGACFVDLCVELEGLQADVPAGYVLSDGDCVELESRPLLITELLANVDGSDTGREFIELYNPNDALVNLDGYLLHIGKTFEDDYDLGDLTGTSTLAPDEYLVVYDTQLGFTLLNTNSGVRLTAPAANVVSETTYDGPADDQSWSSINDTWQYTNRPTPGADNLPSLVTVDDDTVSVTTSLTPCPTGKYRSPLTNRCRNIESDASVLATCDDDEYRNPETNRCRKIATLTSGLSSCTSGYERNPETNRCRMVAGSSTTLAPCQAGYERNVTTNRCRKALASATLTETAAPSQQSSAGDLVKNGLFVTAGIGAVSYGLYEWRSELIGGVRRVLRFVFSK